jgi:DNA modification methylase
MGELIAELETELWDLRDLKPDPENPRTHPKRGSPKWEALRKSLALDYFDPIGVNRLTGIMFSGHFRRDMLMDLGYTKARVVVKDYDKQTHRARLIAANTLLGEFEETLLGALARELDTAQVDPGLAGLTDKEMMALIEGPITIDDSETAGELTSKWKVQLGDIYQIGPHRLVCGDCSLADNWQLALQGRLIDVWWLDPPYNIDYKAVQEHRSEAKEANGKPPGGKALPIQNDKQSDGAYSRLLHDWFASAFAHSKPGASIYIAHAEGFRMLNEGAARDVGYHISQCLVWVKNSFTLTMQDYKSQHESILYGWKRGAAHYWQGGFNKSTLIDDEPDLSKKSKAELKAIINELRNERLSTVARHPKGSSEGLHPTIKPLKLVADQIWNSSRRGDAVGDLFSGSGTTMAACHQTGRECYTTELEPTYCAVTLERMAGYGLEITKVHELR